MEVKTTVVLQPDPISVETGTDGLAPCVKCQDVLPHYVSSIDIDNEQGDPRPTFAWRCGKCDELTDYNPQDTLWIVLRERIQQGDPI